MNARENICKNFSVGLSLLFDSMKCHSGADNPRNQLYTQYTHALCVRYIASSPDWFKISSRNLAMTAAAVLDKKTVHNRERSHIFEPLLLCGRGARHFMHHS